MPGICVVGMQWGDEGKARIVDLLSEEYEIVVRTGGGSNAGHTVVIGEEIYRLHLIPAGVLRPGKLSIIGPGVVFDPKVFAEEVEALRSRGISIGENLLISDRCHVVFPFHKALDSLSESKKGGAKLGTTGRGIGPCYADKAARTGIRLSEMLDAETFRERLERLVAEKNALFRAFGEATTWDARALFDEYWQYAQEVRPLVVNTTSVLARALAEGKKVLFEGAQGSLLDIDHGTYPFVTSCNSSALGVPAGAGISPKWITKIIGALKAYTTRVGSGPFPTELFDETGEHLQRNGKEFGTTTGRPRRCGWLDLVGAKYAASLNRVDALAITKLDILSGIDPVRVCVAYEKDGQRTSEFPADEVFLESSRPVYEEIAGWKERIEKVRSFDDLPKNARAYVRYIERALGATVEIVSVGPERGQSIRIPS